MHTPVYETFARSSRPDADTLFSSSKYWLCNNELRAHCCLCSSDEAHAPHP